MSVSTVNIKAHTVPYESGLSVEEFIAHVARVSNPANENNNKTAQQLIRYLIKHKHWSPLELANVVLEIYTPRDIARQILRHRSFSFQEWSQRYADPTGILGFTQREARLQDLTNRQNSLELTGAHPEADWLEGEWKIRQAILLEHVQEDYDWAIEHGIAKEVARTVLPEGLTMSRMYVNGTLRSWMHYCLLRMGKETQKEHREVATMCWNNLIVLFPSIATITLENT
jgi:thymidylate synthase (FAD)